MVEVSHARQIAIKILRFQKRTEVELFVNDRLSFELDPLLPFAITRLNVVARFCDAEKDTDFFKQFSHHCNPVAESFVRLVAAGKNFLRPPAGKSATSRQHLRRIIVTMNRPAGKDVEAAEEVHFRRPASQKNFKTAVIAGPDEHDSRSVAGMNHISRVNTAAGLGVRSQGFHRSLLLTLHYLLLTDLPKQLFPFLVFFFILRRSHTGLGVETFEVGFIHRAVETELSEKFLALGTKQEITEQ